MSHLCPTTPQLWHHWNSLSFLSNISTLLSTNGIVKEITLQQLLTAFSENTVKSLRHFCKIYLHISVNLEFCSKKRMINIKTIHQIKNMKNASSETVLDILHKYAALENQIHLKAFQILV